MSTPASTVGIDVGATLCKVVRHERRVETARHASTDLERVRGLVERWRPARIAATGGGAAELGAEVAGVPVQHVPEFEAWARGGPLVAGLAGVELPREYLLVSLGTGTSVLSVRNGAAERTGGSALGGGSLLGLGRLLLGVETFAEIAALAATGDRRRVDLLVGDIYRRGGIPLPPDLNAASFGKLASRRPEDLAHALMGLVGENVAIICASIARAAGVKTIVYCGSTLDENRALEQVLSMATRLYGAEPVYLAQGAYCGAFGAAALAR
jgi:type II pantothenate kinase